MKTYEVKMDTNGHVIFPKKVTMRDFSSRIFVTLLEKNELINENTIVSIHKKLRLDKDQDNARNSYQIKKLLMEKSNQH
jgi:hypothetical protein